MIDRIVYDIANWWYIYTKSWFGFNTKSTHVINVYTCTVMNNIIVK